MLIELLLLKKVSSLQKAVESQEFYEDDADDGNPLLLIALWVSLFFTWPVLVGSLIRATGRSWAVTALGVSWAVAVTLLFGIYTLIGLIAIAVTLVWFLVVAVSATA